jgi:hypothetical protein
MTATASPDDPNDNYDPDDWFTSYDADWLDQDDETI